MPVVGRTQTIGATSNESLPISKSFGSVSTQPDFVIIDINGNLLRLRRNLIVEFTMQKTGNTASLSFSLPEMEGATEATKARFSNFWNSHKDIVFIIISKYETDRVFTPRDEELSHKKGIEESFGLKTIKQYPPYQTYFLLANSGRDAVHITCGLPITNVFTNLPIPDSSRCDTQLYIDNKIDVYMIFNKSNISEWRNIIDYTKITLEKSLGLVK